MTRRLHPVLGLGLLAYTTAVAAGLDIVKDGRPAATIVVPPAGEHWDMTAAQWLQQYVEKATGAKLPIVKEQDKPQTPLISIGRTALAKAAGIAVDDLKYDGCKIVVKGGTLYLIGRDTPGLTPNSLGYTAGARGTCRAVTRFLEDSVGVRWLVPTPQGEVVPQVKSLSAPDDLAASFSPAFAYVHGRYLYDYGPAGIANNCRTSAMIRSYGGHSYYEWVPEKEHAAKHPEYFALVQGKRVTLGNHLCTSNPEVRELLRKGMLADFGQGYEWVANGQTDGYKRCECPACETMDNFRDEVARPGESFDDWLERLKANPCERLHLTHKWLIDEAARKYPDRKVHLLAYGPTLTPSKKFDYYGDNVIVEVCGNGDPQFVSLWKGKAAGLTVYTVWYDVTVGLGMDQGCTPAEVSKRVRWLHENGVIGIYLGGGGHNWGYFGPAFYVLGRMAGDPTLDYRKLVAEYCRGLYGPAAEDMNDFFDLLYSRVSIQPPGPAVTIPDMQILRYPPAFINQLEELLAKAEAKANSQRAKNFIRMTRDQFDYNKLLTRALMEYRTYTLAPTEAAWRQTQKAVEEFDAFREKLVKLDDAFADQWYPGHGDFCNFLTSQDTQESYYQGWRSRREAALSKPLRGTVIGYGSTSIRYPLVLDFSRRPVLGAIEAARAAAPPKLDGTVDGEWSKAAPQPLAPMLAGQAAAATQFRLMYDDKNLYVAYECDEPMMEKLVASTVGRDGPVWNMDCGEILLAPDRSRRRYYHWIIAPAPNAVYDDRTGYQTLDDQDASWNGPVEYAFQVDKANKRWTLEIALPYSTLGATPPQPGDWWLGNFGRERQALKTNIHSAPDLLLWSQQEAAGFANPQAFGRIVFAKP